MGGWDFYCGICGGPLSTPYWDEQEQRDTEARHEYNIAVLSSTEDPRLEWLSKFKVVSEKPSYYNSSVPEGWISGPCSSEEYGSSSVKLPEQDAQEHGDPDFDLEMYEGMEDSPFTVPFHDHCHSILLKYIGKDKLDADVFYETVKNLAGEGGYNSMLGDIRYGVVQECMEQYWCTWRGTEWFVLSPLDIPELDAFFDNLPKFENEPANQAKLRGPSKHDPFTSLAPEIIVNVMSSLEVEDMGNLRLASRVARNLELGNHFWKQKVFNGMPWLFDLPDSAKQSTSVDWKRICGRMLHASTASRKTVIHGLANRRRIWNDMIPQFAKPYLENLAIRQLDRADEPEVFSKSKSTPSAILVDSEPKDAKASTVALLQTPQSVATASIDIRVCFNKEEEISDIKVTETERQILPYDIRNVHRLEEVTIPDDVWITGCIITTRGEKSRPVGIEILLTEGEPRKLGETGEGGKRLIRAPRDNFIVGFRLHISKKEDLLCRLGLIFHQSWRAADGEDRLYDYNSNGEMYTNTHVTKYMWRNEVPPPTTGLKATEPYRGYWTFDLHFETTPFEALVFPKNYPENQDLVAIAADVQFGGFELRFAERPTRSIGPKRQAMKVLDIDGKGGELIQTVHICVHHIPTSIRIVTNRGRQLIVGQPDNTEKRLPEAEGLEEHGQYPVNGIFGWWDKRDSVQASLSAIGAFYDVVHTHDPITDVARQIGGLVWEPSKPDGVETVGPVIGVWHKGHEITSRERSVPDDCNLLSWLDFSRPIASLQVTMCHSLDTNEIPLVGIRLAYADGNKEEASIGPSEFHPPEGKGTTASGQHWCWCQLAGAKIPEELEQVPHYQHHEWNLGGKHLSCLRVFVSKPERQGNLRPLGAEKGKAATAIQFVAEDGVESPVWGYWQRAGGEMDEELCEIKFGKGKGDAVGVKFFIGQNGRAVTREDHTVQAFQALIKPGG